MLADVALLLGDPVTDLPLALEINYFRLVGDHYFVPVAVKIAGSEAGRMMSRITSSSPARAARAQDVERRAHRREATVIFGGARPADLDL